MGRWGKRGWVYYDDFDYDERNWSLHGFLMTDNQNKLKTETLTKLSMVLRTLKTGSRVVTKWILRSLFPYSTPIDE